MGRFDYDLVVIGGGAAGLVSSKLARGFGKRVALVESHRLGGECTLYGCIPSKTLISAARAAGVIKDARKYGLRTGESQTVVTDNVMAHVRAVVDEVYRGHAPETIAELGIHEFFGEAVFRDSHHIAIGDKLVSSDKFIIATGSSSSVPEIAGISAVPFLTNETLFSIDRLPASMIIIGGGPVGAELGSALNSLGVTIDLVHDRSRILDREDSEMVDILSSGMLDAGMRLHTGCTASAVRKDGAVISLDANTGGRLVTLSAEALLVAAGRRPNIGGLGLDHAGVKYTPEGIWTDGRLRTSAPNIYACGDVVGPYRFSHMAEYQALVAVRNAFLPFQKKADYEHVAWCTFTDPELARAGLTEEEARERYGDRIRVYRQAYRETDRGRTDSEDIGMSKFICHRGRLVGAHILGAHAGELIHEAQVVKSLGIPFHRLYEVIHVYPTFTDVVKHPAKLCYIDRLRDNIFLKILKRFL
jgi:pyruvate/2-oxoglutarate dehydrogenase complex dihydrolipoamide dehydrogenase (E3) component